MKEFQSVYFEMCKTSKIQDLWVPEIGDYCFIYDDLPLLIKEVVLSSSYGCVDLQFISGNVSNKGSTTWLPLQYQLFNILSSNRRLNQNLWAWSIRFTEFCRTFDLSHFHGTDWEMCWLPFIEHYLWNREWENDAWIEKDINHWLQKESVLGTYIQELIGLNIVKSDRCSNTNFK